jgi:hypothetical protein
MQSDTVYTAAQLDIGDNVCSEQGFLGYDTLCYGADNTSCATGVEFLVVENFDCLTIPTKGQNGVLAFSQNSDTVPFVTALYN